MSELENAQKCKSVPRLLSMVVGMCNGRQVDLTVIRSVSKYMLSS